MNLGINADVNLSGKNVGVLEKTVGASKRNCPNSHTSNPINAFKRNKNQINTGTVVAGTVDTQPTAPAGTTVAGTADTQWSWTARDMSHNTLKNRTYC